MQGGECRGVGTPLGQVSARRKLLRAAVGHFSGMRSGASVCIKTSSVGGRIDQTWRTRRHGRPLQWGGSGFPKLPGRGQAGWPPQRRAWDSRQPGRCLGGPDGLHQGTAAGAKARAQGGASGAGEPPPEGSSQPGRTSCPGAESRLCHLAIECKTLEKLLAF